MWILHRGGVEAAAKEGKKNKNTFWGFLGACYQNFDFFSFPCAPPFWFVLRFLGPVSLFLG